jgi:hypothetical protein
MSQSGHTLDSYLLGPVLGIGTYGEVRFAIHKDTGMFNLHLLLLLFLSLLYSF